MTPNRDDGSCRYPSCDEESRERGEGVGTFGAQFCSLEHELKYEHLKADAEDAERAREHQQGVAKRDRPEYDGPPY
jgi:hypothetical protein